MSARYSLLEAARHRIGPVLFLTTAAATLVLAAAAAVWLQIPDSHTWQFVFSMLFGAAILVLSLRLYTVVIQLLRLGVPAVPDTTSKPPTSRLPLLTATPRGRRAMWRGAGLLALWLILWHILSHLAGLLTPGIETRAGFWNSRLSPHARTLFTYPRLVSWQQDIVETLLWFVIPSLILPFLVETVSHGVTRPALARAARLLRRWQLWLTVAVAGVLASTAWEKLTDWHPASSVPGELFSAALRLPLACMLGFAISLMTLAVLAELLSRPRPPAS